MRRRHKALSSCRTIDNCCSFKPLQSFRPRSRAKNMSSSAYDIVDCSNLPNGDAKGVKESNEIARIEQDLNARAGSLW